MSNPSRVLAVAVCLLGALAIALFFWAPGKKPATREALRVTPAGSGTSVASPLAPAIRGNGTISGEVQLVGTPPTMQPLKVGADPICASDSSHDEQVIATEGRLSNVFVRIADAPPEPPPSTPVVVDQAHCIFRPRLQGAVRGQVIQIRNGDRTLHNTHGYAGGSTLFNYAQPASSQALERQLPGNSGVVKLKCDVHPWMTAFVFVTDNPYYAVTGADGRFAIHGVPAGTYRVEAWHERFGVKARKVSVGEDGTVRADFSYSTEDRG
ncbi:MAG TPA: carboxypeptidase regulatory-like domain-containing protein [Myxococcaceae bacterium]|nr:carboxypeptidase regulatory-like domain-containing protein [Myxococcaceae bacterium]